MMGEGNGYGGRARLRISAPRQDCQTDDGCWSRTPWLALLATLPWGPLVAARGKPGDASRQIRQRAVCSKPCGGAVWISCGGDPGGALVGSLRRRAEDPRHGVYYSSSLGLVSVEPCAGMESRGPCQVSEWWWPGNSAQRCFEGPMRDWMWAAVCLGLSGPRDEASGHRGPLIAARDTIGRGGRQASRASSSWRP